MVLIEIPQHTCQEQQISQLARRMAGQADKTGKRQVLESMPAGEST